MENENLNKTADTGETENVISEVAEPVDTETAVPEAIEPADTETIIPEPTDPAGTETVIPEPVETDDTALPAGAQPAPAPRRKAFAPLIAILAVALAAGGGAYWYLHSDLYEIRKIEKEAAKYIEEHDYSKALLLYYDGMYKGLDNERLGADVEELQQHMISYMKEQAASSIENGLYAEAVDTFARLKEMDAPLDDVMDSFRQALIKRGEELEGAPEVDYREVLDFYDRAREYIPDLGDFVQEKVIGVLTAEIGNTLEFSHAEEIYKDAVNRYFQSDEICSAVDGAFRTHVRKLLEDELRSLAMGGFAQAVIDGDFEKTFDLLIPSGIKFLGSKASAYIDFPVIAALDGPFEGKDIGFHYEDTSPTFYIGGHDENGKRSGDGIYVYERTDVRNSDLYVRMITRGHWDADELNGSFFERFLLMADNRRELFINGNMKDSRYDGEIDAILSVSSLDGKEYEEYDMVFNYRDGHAQVIGTTAGSDGSLKYIYGVDKNNKENRFTSSRDVSQTLSGLYPRYDAIILSK